jgi:hypothetical protein
MSQLRNMLFNQRFWGVRTVCPSFSFRFRFRFVLAMRAGGAKLRGCMTIDVVIDGPLG